MMTRKIGGKGISYTEGPVVENDLYSAY